MRIRLSTPLLLAVLTGACVGFTDGKSSVLQMSTPAQVEAAEQRLNRLANDPDANGADRAAAVFALFKHHLKPGDSLQEVRRVLSDTSWVEKSKLYYFAILGGWIPVDMNFEDRTYCLHLFPDDQGHSEWVIYFQLAGKSEWGRWQEDGIAFLHGKPGSTGESRVKEFALCYPGGKIETFNRK